jgi:hypothetical protein
MSINPMEKRHCLCLTRVEVLALVSAATHGVRNGYDDAPEQIESAINHLLEQADIDCKFDEDGTMTLVINTDSCPECSPDYEDDEEDED